MTEKDLFREIGMIDEKYVEEAASVKRAKILTPAFRKTLATAACLCICVGIYFSIQAVREESDESARDSERKEYMSDATNAMTADKAPNSKAESSDAMEGFFEELAGATGSASEDTTMDTTVNAEPEVDKEYSDTAGDVQTSVEAVEENDIIEELSEYSNDYEELCNGDAFVVTHGKVSAGMDKWEQFLNAVNRGREAQVDVIRFTEEGDAIITRVCYKDGMYNLLEDSTRDAWGNGTYTEYEFAAMNVIKNTEGYVEVIFAEKLIMDSEAMEPQTIYYLVKYRQID